MVLALSATLGMIGVLLVAMLPLDIPVRIAAAAVWAGSVLREVLLLRRAWRNCRAIRLSPGGSVTVLGEDAEWRPGQLVSGGLLLPRFGWLRLRTGTAPAFAELVRGDRRKNRDWRRLHVIWRHFRAPI